MKPLRSWLTRLAFVGAWVIVSGCGSGDVPDPSNDASAENPGASAPPPVNAPAPAAESPQVASAETKSEEAKPEAPAPAPEAAAPTPAAAPETTATAAAPAASDAPATPDKNSATADLLALSSKEPQAAPAAGSGDAANPQAGGPGAAPGPGGPAGPGAGGPGPGGGPPNMPPGMSPPGGGMSPMNMGPNAPGAGGMQAQMAAAGGMQAQMQAQQGQMQQMQQMQAQMQAQMQRGMGGPGAPGAPGAPGGMMGPGGPGGPGGGSSKAPDFRSPQGAVQAFLDAAKEKDLGKLTDATALRAPAEATKRNQDMFTRILDGTYSNEELDKLASFLDGYQLAFLNQAKSTGRQGVVLQKRGDNNSILRIVITARREKKGWGVCDISGVQTIKSPRFGPVRSNSSRR